MVESAQPRSSGLWRRIRRFSAWLPIPACILLTWRLWRTGENPQDVLPQLASGIAFLVSTLISFFIAWLAAQSYRASRGRPVLFLGCGTLAYGCVNIVTVMSLRNVNAALTIYIAGMLVTGLFHLAGAVYAQRAEEPGDPSKTAWPLHLSYSGLVLCLALGTFGAFRRIIPPLYTVAGGTTPPWQMLSIVTAIIFGLGAALLHESHRRTKSDFFRLYSLSLTLFATGLCSQIAINNVLSRANWVGRTAMYLGGIYLLGAVMAAVRESGGWGIALQAALRETRKRYDLLFNAAVEGVIIQDLEPAGGNGKISAANPAICEMLGYAAEEMTRFSIVELAGLAGIAEREGWKADYQALIARGPALREAVLVAKDGRRIPTEISTRAFDSEGKRMALLVVRDISQRKRAEEEIRALNAELELRVAARTAELQGAIQEMEAFSYSVSHDLRAPLRAMHGFSAALEHDYMSDSPAEAHQMLARIRGSAQRMGTLIDDLLRFSRLGRQQLSKGIVSVSQIVEESIKELQAVPAKQRPAVRIGELPDCYGDAALLKQAIFNLLSNAFKFTQNSEAPVVEAGSTRENGELIYFVRDNGAGFDMQFAGKLFGVFQRLHGVEEYPGTGIGLSIASRVIERHGGRIWAKGELNKGAQFYFTIPAPAD